jgi:hypothetical protein
MRLHKMGENYLRFGTENPEYYDLMFIQQAPMEALQCMSCSTHEWEEGDRALDLLKQILKECMDHNLIRKGDINVVAMAIWSMVHGLVSLQNKQRFDKLVPKDQVMRTMDQSLHWLLNTIDTSYSEK